MGQNRIGKTLDVAQTLDIYFRGEVEVCTILTDKLLQSYCSTFYLNIHMHDACVYQLEGKAFS